LTFLYESYYEIVKGGQYYKHVEKMHEQYGMLVLCSSSCRHLGLTHFPEGPLIRVSPHEVHWNDPEFIDQAYPTLLRKTDKPVWVAERTGSMSSQALPAWDAADLRLFLAPYSIVSTPTHDLHRRRRNALNSFFSVANVRRLEPILKSYMQKMMTRIEESGKAEEVIQIHRMFKAAASDIITHYAFGDNMGYMDSPDYGEAFQESTEWFFYLTHIFGLVPWLVQYAQNAPVWLIRLCFPVLVPLRERQDVSDFVRTLACWPHKLTCLCSGGLTRSAKSGPPVIRIESRAQSSKASWVALCRRRRRLTFD
jgi:hypothetical protein